MENIGKGLEPECVKTCPADAMFFGDLDDPESRVSKLIKEWDAKLLHPEHGTKPSIYYTAHAARLRGTIASKKTGQAIRGAIITVKCLGEGQSSSASTDSDGVFFFWDLKIRTKYTVSVEADGFSPSTRELYLDAEYTDLERIPVSEL